jgi:hypothetical protein
MKLLEQRLKVTKTVNELLDGKFYTIKGLAKEFGLSVNTFKLRRDNNIWNAEDIELSNRKFK